MKIVYIGASDALAEALAERMGQEGNDVYLLSDTALPQKTKGHARYRFYRSPRRGKNFEKLLRSLAPDCVIFSGNHYISGGRGEDSDGDVTLLARSLRSAAAFPRVKFILLSSIEVYGNTGKKADELAACAAAGERGIRFIREEQLLGIYRKRYDMDAVILRASPLYSNHAKEGGEDFLSRIFSAAVTAEGRMEGSVFQPLHIADFVDAVKRVIYDGKREVYNVCGSAESSAGHLYELVCRQEKFPERPVQWDAPGCVTLADSGRIRKELGWGDFWDLEKQLQEGAITFERLPARERGEKKRIVPAWLRQTVENLLIFAVFFALNTLCGSHSLFSQIDWMMIYVILISISYKSPCRCGTGTNRNENRSRKISCILL